MRPTPLACFYLATPLFAVADHALGFSCRVAFLDGHPLGKALYYLGCTLLGLLHLRRGRNWAPVLGLLESAGNILLLVLSVMLPLSDLSQRVFEGREVVQPFSAAFFVNFTVVGACFLHAFHNNPIVRRSPPLWRF
jgi:hypothetical protein